MFHLTEKHIAMLKLAATIVAEALGFVILAGLAIACKCLIDPL